MEENTYIASNGKKFSFFCDSFTYIASNKAASEFSSISLPVSIFQNDLSALEAVSKYLKEEKQLRFCHIAKLLNRDDRTIWDAYDGAKKKQPRAHSGNSQILIPLAVFADRTFSMLESLTVHLKEICNLRLCHIAILLNKDARTIWTVYSRIKKKRKSTVIHPSEEASIQENFGIPSPGSQLESDLNEKNPSKGLAAFEKNQPSVDTAKLSTASLPQNISISQNNGQKQ